MKENLRTFCVLLIGLSLLSANSVGQKPAVAVHFRVEATAYQRHFGADTSSIEARVTQNFVKELRQNISFLDFVPASTGSSSYVLNFRLSVPDPSRDAATQRVLIYSWLSAPGESSSGARWQWFKFRDALSECYDASDAHCNLPNGQGFIEELNALMASASYEDLVRNVLKQIPVLSGQGRLLAQQPPGWVLPFRPAEICMDLKSRFRVAGTVPSDAADITGTFLAEMEGPYRPTPDQAIFGRLLRGETDDDESVKPLFLQNHDTAKVNAVYVIDYRRPSSGSCGGAISPMAANGGGE